MDPLRTSVSSGDYPSAVAAECMRMGTRIAKRATHARHALLGMRVFMSVVGLAAIMAAYVPAITTAVGDAGAKTVSLVCAVTLILTAVISIFIDKNPPERYVDYSRYILGYTGRIGQVRSDDSLPAKIKSARLDEVLILANKNIEDVRSMWPWIDDDK